MTAFLGFLSSIHSESLVKVLRKNDEGGNFHLLSFQERYLNKALAFPTLFWSPYCKEESSMQNGKVMPTVVENTVCCESKYNS